MAELRLALSDALGPLNRVEREVRPVGDCRLFVAHPITAGPDFLVKVLPGALSLAIDARAFEREVILLADRLGHEGLVAPRGAGRAGPFVYHTRPFVEGTTLRAWLQNHRSVPLARAVEILRDVLSALAHAHAAHVAHGDLRPENVLLTDGRILMADAGIVGAVGRSLTAGAPGAVSAALCAPAYLAPGRAKPDEPPTPRDDMFAVSVLVYEMLTGRPPRRDGEPLEQGRTLPPWLPELLRRRWADAGEALAAMRPPPPRPSRDQPQL
ncbi:MAG TPA: protein kinase [Gemmatimonadales bacterium]|nr:protein kinase [Gemmatimonadales bacterium]